MEKRKVAIVGAGHIAESHYKGFIESGAEVAAVVNHHIEKAKTFADKFSISTAFETIDEMLLSRPDVEIVSICTPNKYHREMAIKALRAGKHVYCEKPPALNAKETKAMVKEAEKSGKLLVFAFNNRARKGSEYLKGIIREGRLGTINSVQAEWTRKRGIPGFGGWFTNKELSGGGPVIDLLHMLDLSLYMMGYPEPEYVMARNFDTFINDPEFSRGMPVGSLPVDVESASHAMITFREGQTLFSRCSWAEMIKEECCEIALQGTKSGAKLMRSEKDKNVDVLEVYSFEETESISFEKDGEMGRTFMIGRFMEAVEGGAVDIPQLDEAVSIMKIVDAIYLSAKTGKPVKII